MLRILRMSSSRSLGPQESFKALEAAGAAAKAAEAVPGIKWCSFYLGSGALVFAADMDGYAAADRALADSGIQAAFGRLGVEFGYGVIGDEFFLDPAQVYPFLQSAAPASTVAS
jgi:hypothetical protein